MKKYLPLLFVFSFALTGCNHEISNEQAGEIVTSIKTKEIDPQSIKQIKYTYRYAHQIDGKVDGKVFDNKSEDYFKIEVSKNFNYLHILVKSKTKDKLEDKTTNKENEMWCYLKKKILYSVTRTNTNGVENKRYTKNEDSISSTNEFNMFYNTFVMYYLQDSKSSPYLNLDYILSVFNTEYNHDVEYITKLFSSGEGNLRIASVAKIDQTYENDKHVKGSAALTSKWNEYMLKTVALTYTIKIKDGINKNDFKENISTTQRSSDFFIPIYPNLNKYTLSGN